MQDSLFLCLPASPKDTDCVARCSSFSLWNMNHTVGTKIFDRSYYSPHLCILYEDAIER